MPAKSIRHATSKGLALSISKEDDEDSITLYDPLFLKRIVIESERLNQSVKKNGGVDNSHISLGYASIYGFLHVTDEDTHFRVSGSASRNGYGPMLYDIAMSRCGKKGLTPDNYVSEQAQEIWFHYFFKRKNEVKTKRRETSRFKNKALSSIYTMNNRKTYKSMIRNHIEFTKFMKRIGKSSSSEIKECKNVFETFF